MATTVAWQLVGAQGVAATVFFAMVHAYTNADRWSETPVERKFVVRSIVETIASFGIGAAAYFVLRTPDDLFQAIGYGLLVGAAPTSVINAARHKADRDHAALLNTKLEVLDRVVKALDDKLKSQEETGG